ncbi:MAG: lysophospholipid acyltransferase family protein [Lentisphaerota bacterium]
MTYKISHILEYALLRVLSGVVNLLPHKGALLLGWAAAAISFPLLKSKMRRTQVRIKQVFGARYSDREVREISRRAWRTFMFNMVESMRTPRVTLPWIKKVVDLTDVPMAFDNMKDGKGLILAVPHMGNWELAGIATQMLGLRLMLIVRRQKNPLLDAYLTRLREYTGVEAFAREGKSFAGLVHKLKEGKVLAILPDLRAKGNALPVHFMGATASIAGGMALFAREAGVPILPACTIRTSWARHSWKGRPPIYPDYSLDKDADILRMTQYVMTHFDDMIATYPDQYFWFNSRWILGDDR